MFLHLCVLVCYPNEYIHNLIRATKVIARKLIN